MLQVVRDEEEDQWEPPNNHIGVIKNERFTTWMKLIDMATRNTKSNLSGGDKPRPVSSQKFRNKEEAEEFHEILAASVPKGK